MTALVRATASSVAALLFSHPAAAAAPLRFGVLNAACTPERIEAERAAGITAVELPLAWDRYEPQPGRVDPDYVAEAVRKVRTCRAAGMDVVLGPGLQYPPAWVLALPDAALRGCNRSGHDASAPHSVRGGCPAPDQDGHTAAHGGLDLVFNAAVRTAAHDYLGRLAADLPLHDVAAVRIGVSGTGELAFPGPHAGGGDGEYWAFGAAPQTGAGLADGASVSPMPGWVPGQREWQGAAVTPAQVDAWFGWYATSLVDTVAWQVGRLRELGYTGDVHVPVAGRGVLPADRAAAVDGLLDGRADPDGALERGLDYPRQFPVLAGLPGVVIDFTGLDDAQAVAARAVDQDRCRPDDDGVGPDGAGLLDRTDTAAWPGQRFTSALARHLGLRLVGENPGAPDAPHTGGDPASDTSAQQLQRAPDYAQECGMTEFYWAFEDDLFTPGSGVDLETYSARIAAARAAAPAGGPA